MPTTLEYMKFSLNVYKASLENIIGVPFGWERAHWQPDLTDGFSAGTFVKDNWKKALKIIGLAVALATSLTACGASTITWKEEVQLSDGKVIVVERETIYERGGAEWASNSAGLKPKEDGIRFEYPIGSGKWVEWRTTKKDLQTYPETPLVFDVYSNQPTIFSLVAISLGCEVYSKYVYKNGTWAEESLPDLFEQHPTNLLFASQRNLPKLLKLADKKKRNDDIGHRKALYQVGPNRKVCD